MSDLPATAKSNHRPSSQLCCGLSVEPSLGEVKYSTLWPRSHTAREACHPGLPHQKELHHT